MVARSGSGDLYLALETATDVPSLALGSPGNPGEDLRVSSRRDLSRDIETAARDLLARAGAAVRDLAGVVVSDGPGSFTGLRIGIAFAKGLCRAGGLPFVAAPSLLGAALHASGGWGAVLAEYDALRGDVYRALYRFRAPAGTASGGGGGVEVLMPPALVPREAPAPSAGPEPLHRAGASDASAAALLALLGIPGAAARIERPDAWEPVYGRLAEAEARRRARGD